jgi:di/tricarboxylate transporter
VADLLVQAVVAPQSDLMSRTIGEVDFRQRYGALVVSLWRKEGWLQQELAHTRLSAGDVPVLQGDAEALARVEGDPAFLLLVPFQGDSRQRRKASLAGGIMLASVVVAAFNLLPSEMAALAGAVAMVLSGCLSTRQAYQAIDARIYVFIAGAIPWGTAMQQSATSDLLAGWLQTALSRWSQTLILLALFAVVGVATQFMSDAATTALFAPVAVILVQALGHPPEPYVVTVAMAAVVSFLTPIGHHGNLLVYGPGGYHFTDFVRVGNSPDRPRGVDRDLACPASLVPVMPCCAMFG